MSDERRPVAVRLYAMVLRALPRAVASVDGEEMARTFEALWTERMPRRRRIRLALHAVVGIGTSILMEWAEELGFVGPHARGGWGMMGWIGQLRFALRTLRKAPMFVLTSVLLIGMGVGAVTTIFTMVDHVLLRPLPYPAADRLVTVERGSHSGISYRAFEQIGGFEQWVAGYEQTANLTGEGDPIRIEVATVSEEFFRFFGARPALGRLFVADDFEAPSAVVISAEAWRSVFGGDPELVGRTVRVNGSAYTVLGVLDESFEAPRNIVSTSAELYRPIDWTDEALSDAGRYMLEAAARLAPGVEIADLQPRFDALAERLAREYPDQMMNSDGEWAPFPLAELQASTVRRVRDGLHLLLGAVGILLLVACLNVAHLFLARGLGRAQEMAVRRALGAGTGRLIQQLLAESLVIGVLGGALGLAVAWLGLDLIMSLNPEALPRSEAIGIDLRIASFAGAVSALTAVLFGVLPALRTVGTELTDELKGSSRGATSSRGAQRLRGGLVVAEVALSLILVAQAGLLLKSFMQVQAHQTGIDARDVWTIPLTPTHVETPEEYRLAMNEVLRSLASLPGVEHASFGLTQPFEFVGGGRCCWSRSGMTVDGEEDRSDRMMLHPVTPGYFETLGSPLVAGSMWSEADEDQRPVPGVLTERAAIDLFGSAEEALGHVFGSSGGLHFRVVGVAADIKHYGLDQPDPAGAYIPLRVVPFTIPMAHMAVRLRGEAPPSLARSLREAVWRAEPDMPVPTVRSMEDWIRASTSGRRFDSAVYGAFGGAALLLAAAGLYGTLLYNVRQRRRELGIRLALGAARSAVERQVVRRGLVLALVGAVAGVAGAVWVGARLQDQLYQVEGSDPTALGGAAILLLLTATVASWVPARRAGRTDPIETLKAE